MKIYKHITIDMETLSIVDEDSYQYEGPLALAIGAVGGSRGSDPDSGRGGRYGRSTNFDSIQKDWEAINADIGIPQQVSYGTDTYDVDYGTAPSMAQTGVGYGINALSALNPIAGLMNLISRQATGDSFGAQIADNLFGGPWGTMAPGPMIGFDQLGRLDDQGLPFGSVSDQGFGNNQSSIPPGLAQPAASGTPPGFQINPMQVQNDMMSGAWGSPQAGGYQLPQMNPMQMYGGTASPFDWGGYFPMFGGK